MSEATRKKKLVIFENNLIIGGVQRLVLDQLRTLDRKQLDVTLITLTQPDRETFYDRVPENVPVVKLSMKGMTDVKGWISAYKTLKAEQPDVVKSTTYFSNTIARIFQPFLRYALICAEHNTKEGKNLRQKLTNRLLRRFSATTVVDSIQVAEYLSKSESIPLDHYMVINNGVDLQKIQQAEAEYRPRRDELRAKYGIQNNDILFLNIARMVKQKNQIRMIESYAKVAPEFPQSKLLIVGDGTQRPNIEAKIEECGVGDRVILVGMQSDVYPFYVMSDVTVMSSDHEGFSIAAIEGLGVGAPMVSTKVAGSIDYIKDGENGFLADFTADSLAEAMSKMLKATPEEYSIMQEGARRTAVEYSVERYGQKFNELLIAVLAK